MTLAPVNYGAYGNATISNSTELEYVVTYEVTPVNGTQSTVLEHIALLTEVAKSNDVGSFWALDLYNSSSTDLYVFSRFGNKAASQAFDLKTVDLWQSVVALSQSYRRTTWVSHGIGFISR